jgi:3-methyladenine DNA glycosylase AlkD
LRNGVRLKADNSKHLAEITSVFLNSGKKYPPELEKRLRENNYKTNYKLHNIDREKLRKNLSKLSFQLLSLEEKAVIWSELFMTTDYMGLGHLAIDFFKGMQNKKSLKLSEFWPLLKPWAKRIENWAHGDMLASLYCQILSEKPAEVLPVLQKWNKEKSPWMKRMSIVSLLYYYHPKRHTPDFKTCISFIDNHLEIDHYYLQKAIGWNLRELTKAHHDKAFEYMKKNHHKISSIAFSASIEKLPAHKKNYLKEMRAKARSKQKSKKL